MHPFHPELTEALGKMLEKLDQHLTSNFREGEKVGMFVAGGMAMHYHCGTRYTEDVDASFSHRLLLPYQELTVAYAREDGSSSTIFLDPNYNGTFAVMHPDHRDNAVVWQGLEDRAKTVALRDLTPLDLAVSKIARFAESDREDILTLARHRLIDSAALRKHFTEALGCYVGDTRWVCLNLDEICGQIDALTSSNTSPL